MNKNVPCYNCLILPICIARFKTFKNPIHGIANVSSRCKSLLNCFMYSPAHEHSCDLLKVDEITEFFEGAIKNAHRNTT